MAITLASMLGQIGLPGGGFGFGYGSVNGIGNAAQEITWPSLSQGENPVADFIPVARIADMLLDPGGACRLNGERRNYPDIKLVYWAGGNPVYIIRTSTAWSGPGSAPRRSSCTSPGGRPPPAMPTSSCPSPRSSSATTSSAPIAT